MQALEEVTDCIRLLCGFRREQHSYERALAAIRFSTWALWPDESAVREQARIAGAANLIVFLSGNKAKNASKRDIESISKRELTPEVIAKTLRQPPFSDAFSNHIKLQLENLALVGELVYFIAACPIELKPSLNKAVFYVESGGLGRDYKWSRASLRDFWVTWAVSAPFYVAQETSEVALIGLAPDRDNDLKQAVRAVDNVDGIREYFGCAKLVQRTLVSRLSDRSMKRFEFVRFPQELKEYGEINPLTDEDIAIAARYRAPVPTF